MRDMLDPGDFYSPAHGHIAEAILTLDQVDAHVDATTVGNHLAERKLLDMVGGLAYLIQLLADAPSIASAATHAATILDRAIRRRIKSVVAETILASDDLAVPPADIIHDTTGRLRALDIPTGAAAVPDIDQFLEADMQYQWIVPGLLELGDRLLITGGEGAGKSTLLRQLAVQLSAGIHPWRNGTTFRPVRVLEIDLENSAMQVSRKLASLRDLVRYDRAIQPALGEAPPAEYDPDLLRVEVRPQGINLLTRADRRWFTERVAGAQPDVIVTGPVYKMHGGNPNDEEPAAEIARYLDDIRATYSTALIIEAHSPHQGDGKHRTLRPAGTSFWLRWPEFGFGVRPSDDPGVFDWVAWRGPRDDGRTWPAKIKRGTRWPWVNAYGDDAGPPWEPAPGDEPF